MTFQELFDNFLDENGLYVIDWDLVEDGLMEAGFSDGLETEVKGE
jgi:hypothetical protein